MDSERMGMHLKLSIYWALTSIPLTVLMWQGAKMIETQSRPGVKTMAGLFVSLSAMMMVVACLTISGLNLYEHFNPHQ